MLKSRKKLILIGLVLLNMRLISCDSEGDSSKVSKTQKLVTEEKKSAEDFSKKLMSKKTYKGSCHCGRVRYEADIDLSVGSGKCNCSICTKTRKWGVIVKPDAFRLLAGSDDINDYQFNSKTAHHLFCKHCGVHSFGRGYLDELGGEYYSINLACLDDVDIKELVNTPVRYMDGRNNNWFAKPTETRHM